MFEIFMLAVQNEGKFKRKRDTHFVKLHLLFTLFDLSEEALLQPPSFSLLFFFFFVLSFVFSFLV